MLGMLLPLPLGLRGYLPLFFQVDTILICFRKHSKNIRWFLPTNRPIFSWTENRTTPQSPLNPTVQKRIDLQVARKQLQTQTGSTANFLTREDNSKDLLGKFHKDKSVWIRARHRVHQCISYQFLCTSQLEMWGILNEVKCRLCEKYCRKCGAHTMVLPNLTTPTDRQTSRHDDDCFYYFQT